VKAIDWTPTRINSLTSGTPPAIRIPMNFPTDRECLEAVAQTVGRFSQEDVTIGWIRNTMELSLAAVTENLRPEIEKNPLAEIVETGIEWPFDAAGNLASPLGLHTSAAT
jgi:hypothetical protein